MKRWDKIESEGWEFVSFCYMDGSQHLEANRQMDYGYEVKFLREKSDTNGLKMVSVWRRK